MNEGWWGEPGLTQGLAMAILQTQHEVPMQPNGMKSGFTNDVEKLAILLYKRAGVAILCRLTGVNIEYST